MRTVLQLLRPARGSGRRLRLRCASTPVPLARLADRSARQPRLRLGKETPAGHRGPAANVHTEFLDGAAGRLAGRLRGARRQGGLQASGPRTRSSRSASAAPTPAGSASSSPRSERRTARARPSPDAAGEGDEDEESAKLEHRAAAAWADGLRQVGMSFVPRHTLGPDAIPDRAQPACILDRPAQRRRADLEQPVHARSRCCSGPDQDCAHGPHARHAGLGAVPGPTARV